MGTVVVENATNSPGISRRRRRRTFRSSQTPVVSLLQLASSAQIPLQRPSQKNSQPVKHVSLAEALADFADLDVEFDKHNSSKDDGDNNNNNNNNNNDDNNNNNNNNEG